MIDVNLPWWDRCSSVTLAFRAQKINKKRDYNRDLGRTLAGFPSERSRQERGFPVSAIVSVLGLHVASPCLTALPVTWVATAVKTQRRGAMKGLHKLKANL